MSYCTADQVRDVLVGVDSNVMSDESIENKIGYVEGIINSYLSSRYDVPFAIVPSLVTTICVDMSAYYVIRTLFTRDSVDRSEYLDDFLLKHFDTKTKTGTLYDIINGDVSLVNDDGTVITPSVEEINSNTSDYVPTFDVDDPIDWAVDEDRLGDIADARDE